ncbi:MAG TPA: penicillin-binding protein 1B [Methylococcus sp.]|nr:penicillin-binding protein 1B [Methylococcus sp.]
MSKFLRQGGSESSSGPWSRWFSARLLGVIFTLGLILLAIYLGYQDFVVRKHFEGKRWALPARVYANPVELYPGATVSVDQLVWLLDQLKYRPDATLSSQGSYLRRGNEVLVRTRAFVFPDQQEPSRKVRLRFTGEMVTGLEDLDDGTSDILLRFDPVQIGSFYPALKEDRVLVKLEDVPKPLINALLAVEDRDFYGHMGVSPKAVLRALWQNLKAGGVVQGGSTLTQQLVKNFFLDSRRTWWRKINEAVMALLLEAHYEKDEILEAYLNEIYLGQDGARAIHGFGLASRYYFSRSIEELRLHHIALLVALVRGPRYYDPWRSPERAKERRDRVLETMEELGFVDHNEAEQAKIRPLEVNADPHQAISRYPAFLDLVRRQLLEQYRSEDLTSEGLQIFTTLDVFAQEQLEKAAASTLSRLDPKAREGDRLETAAILTRRANGEIVALLGGRDARSAGFNRALDAVRQIGSLYKPVVYLTALEQPARYTLLTPVRDEAIRVREPGGVPWSPKNYDHQEHGAVPLHVALANSYNLATVRVGLSMGVEQTLATLRRLGVERKVDPLPSLLLGAAAFSPMEVAMLYQTLASDGFVTPLRAIQAVLSPEGRALQRFGLDVRQSLDPGPVFLLNTILQEVMREGTGRPVYNHLPADFNVAGKTGTTNDLRDSWFAGFTGDYVGVVWVGRDDNQPARLTGARGALQIWSAAMRKIAKEPLHLTPPESIVWVRVDPQSGLLADEGCPEGRDTPFIRSSEPAQWAPCATAGSDSDSRGWLRALF